MRPRMPREDNGWSERKRGALSCCEIASEEEGSLYVAGEALAASELEMVRHTDNEFELRQLMKMVNNTDLLECEVPNHKIQTARWRLSAKVKASCTTMDEGVVRTEQVDQSPVITPSDHKVANRQTNLIDQVRATLDGDTNAKSSQEPSAPIRDKEGQTNVAIASTRTVPLEYRHQDRATALTEETLNRSQKERKKRVEKERNTKHADCEEIDSRHVYDITEEVILPPRLTSESRSLNPLRLSHEDPAVESQGWQLEHIQRPNASDPTESSAVPQLLLEAGSKRPSPISHLGAPDTNRLIRSDRFVDTGFETEANVSQSRLCQYETSSETKQQGAHQVVSSDSDRSDLQLLVQQLRSSEEAQWLFVDAADEPEISLRSEHSDLTGDDWDSQDQLDTEVKDYEDTAVRTNKEPHHLDRELIELREDVNYLCEAWLRACDAASVGSKAVAHFQFLVTDSIVDDDNRAKTHEELTSDMLYRCILDMHNVFSILQHEPDFRDEVVGLRASVSTVDNRFSVLECTSQSDEPDWRSMYERECQRSTAFKMQKRALKAEAERMYQPELEQKYEDLQSELLEVRNLNAPLEDKVSKAQAENILLRDEIEQLKNISSHYAEQNKQADLQRKEMQNIINAYRSKVDDSRHWDKDGLLAKNEQLEREQAALNDELERLKTNNIRKDDKIEDLIKTLYQNQQEIEDLRRAWSVGKPTALMSLADKDMSTREEELNELRERQTEQREQEDAEEALKEKVRRLRMGNQHSSLKHGYQDLVREKWWNRWRGDECLSELTDEEVVFLKKVRK